MSRRIKSLHHNLGDKNVVFHSEHRSKKNRKMKWQDLYAKERKRRIAEMRVRDIEKDVDSYGRIILAPRKDKTLYD